MLVVVNWTSVNFLNPGGRLTSRFCSQYLNISTRLRFKEFEALENVNASRHLLQEFSGCMWKKSGFQKKWAVDHFLVPSAQLFWFIQQRSIIFFLPSPTNRLIKCNITAHRNHRNKPYFSDVDYFYFRLLGKFENQASRLNSELHFVFCLNKRASILTKQWLQIIGTKLILCGTHRPLSYYHSVYTTRSVNLTFP